MTSRPEQPRSPTRATRAGRLARPHPAKNRPAGSIYVAVLFVASISAALAVGGFVTVRSLGRTLQLRTDAAEARLLARSGIESVRAVINADPLWRVTQTNGTWFDTVPLGGGTYTVSVVNPLGALSRSSSDPVTVTSVGRVRSATQTLVATIGLFSTSPVSSLATSAAARAGISINQATVLGNSQVLSTNGLLTASLLNNNVSVAVETGLLSTGLAGFTGGTTVLAGSRTYPNPTTVFDSYKSSGSTIAYTALPVGNGGRILDRTLLTPNANSFSTARNTIYVIDCAGGQLTIQNSRIVATLVVLNASLVTVQNSVNWTTPTPNLPALLVQGPLNLACAASVLNESLGTNFNPNGSPYPYSGGTANTTLADTYPSVISGLVYATGNMATSNSVAVHTLISDGSLSVSGTLNLQSDGRYYSSPPAGFSDLAFGLVDNSIQ